MDVVTNIDVAIATLKILDGAIVFTVLVNLIAYWITDLIIGLK